MLSNPNSPLFNKTSASLKKFRNESDDVVSEIKDTFPVKLTGGEFDGQMAGKEEDDNNNWSSIFDAVDSWENTWHNNKVEPNVNICCSLYVAGSKRAFVCSEIELSLDKKDGK
jgi:hypothetical protein